MFSAPTRSRISTFAPSSVPSVTAPFIINFMQPVPLASFPAVEICSEMSAAGVDALPHGDAEVFHEHDLHPAAHHRVGVHKIGHGAHKADALLGKGIAVRGFAPAKTNVLAGTFAQGSSLSRS